MHIDKVLSPVTRGGYKSYIGTPASIWKNYFNNVKPGDNKVALSRSIIRGTFAPIGGNAQNSYADVYRHGVKRHFNINVDDMFGAVIPRVKTNYQHNYKTIPYQKAISMGLKI